MVPYTIRTGHVCRIRRGSCCVEDRLVSTGRVDAEFWDRTAALDRSVG